jgi:hypothetical protein
MPFYSSKLERADGLKNFYLFVSGCCGFTIKIVVIGILYALSSGIKQL